MLKKLCSILIACALVSAINIRPAFGQSENDKQSRHIEKVRWEVAKLRSKDKVRVEVKLLDGTKLKGYIGEADDDHFVVMDTKTGAGNRVAYPQVKYIRDVSPMSGLQLGSVIGIIAGVVVLCLVAKNKD